MVEQTYEYKYVFFIFTPALCSLLTSSLLLLNFFFLSKHLRGYMYHKLSTTLAFFDVIQQVGTILSAPFLFSADQDKCAYREFLFLFGSFCKTLTVLYISGTISYVIHYSRVPAYNEMRRVVIVFGVFTIVCFVLLPVYGAQATLCSDPTAGNFRLSSVDRNSAAAFTFAYLGPIVFCFFLNIILIINTALRLRTMFNSALMKLLVRLLPGPIIFSLALLPSSMFQAVVFIHDKENYILKVLALLGMNLSGALYACFYFYELIRDDMLVTDKPAVRPSNDRARLREGGESIFSDHEGGGADRDSVMSRPSGIGLEFESSMGRGSSFMLPQRNESNNYF